MTRAPAVAARRVDTRSLHERFRAGDPNVLEELASHLLVVLRARLRRAYPGASEDVVVDAAADAIVRYSREPDWYDPQRGASLEHFLYAVSRRDVADRLKADARRLVRESEYSHVLATMRAERLHRLKARALLLQLARGDGERDAIRSWLAMGSSYSSLASELGFTRLQPYDQRRAVKRLKDRIVKRLRSKSRRLNLS